MSGTAYRSAPHPPYVTGFTQENIPRNQPRKGGGALSGTQTAADFSWMPFVIFISLIPGKRVASVGSPELVVPAGRAKRLIVEPNDETRLTCLIFPPQLAARPPFQVPVLRSRSVLRIRIL
jgi:hypothetical protein